MDHVFDNVKNDATLRKFYPSNLTTIKQKYAHFIAGCIGGDIIGVQDIELTHFNINDQNYGAPQKQIQP